MPTGHYNRGVTSASAKNWTRWRGRFRRYLCTVCARYWEGTGASLKAYDHLTVCNGHIKIEPGSLKRDSK